MQGEKRRREGRYYAPNSARLTVGWAGPTVAVSEKGGFTFLFVSGGGPTYRRKIRATSAASAKVLAAIADFERDLIIERTQARQARARVQGKHMGRPPSTTPQQRSVMRKRLRTGETVTAVAKDFAVSRATIISIRDAASAGNFVDPSKG
jgi:DNA invertase Pin-like site-specific DNA recombinase